MRAGTHHRQDEQQRADEESGPADERTQARFTDKTSNATKKAGGRKQGGKQARQKEKQQEKQKGREMKPERGKRETDKTNSGNRNQARFTDTTSKESKKATKKAGGRN
jgi:hypothetical protein